MDVPSGHASTHVWLQEETVLSTHADTAGTHLPVTDSCPLAFAPQGPLPPGFSLDAAGDCFLTPPSAPGTLHLPQSLQEGCTCLCCQASHHPAPPLISVLQSFFFFQIHLFWKERDRDREKAHTQMQGEKISNRFHAESRGHHGV